jgi:hypothetical protein
VEALYAYTQFCLNNPQVRFKQPVHFGAVLEQAAKLFVADKPSLSGERDLDRLMQQSPHLLNLYVTLVYADMTKPY